MSAMWCAVKRNLSLAFELLDIPLSEPLACLFNDCSRRISKETALKWCDSPFTYNARPLRNSWYRVGAEVFSEFISAKYTDNPAASIVLLVKGKHIRQAFSNSGQMQPVITLPISSD